MRDWESYVRARLESVRLNDAERERVIGDLAELLSSAEDDGLRAGRSAEEAHAEALAQVPDWGALGRSLEQAEQQLEVRRPTAAWSSRRGWRFDMWTGMGRELWGSIRGLARHRAFALTVVATLALGVGANAAIFSLVDAVLFTPLPFDQPERIVRIWSTHPERSIEATGVSSGDVRDWRVRTDAFDGIGGWYVMGRTLVTEQTAEVVNVAQVSEDFFAVFGTTPVLGRTFTAEETARATFNSAAAHVGTDPVVVLSHGAWTRRFGASPSILGETILLDRQRWRVIGVMPESFDMPSASTELWIPWSFEGDRPHDQRYLGAVGRLGDGVSLEQAGDSLDAVAAALGEELPESNEGWRTTLMPLREDRVAGSRATLLLVLGAVASVLLIACLNIASLQLVRLGEREKEVVLRLALGASRFRLARQFLTETLLLSLAGLALAVPVAIGALSLLTQALPDGLPGVQAAGLDQRALGYAALLTLVAGVFVGLVPVVAGPRLDLAASMKETGARTSGGAAGWERLRTLLVVAELGIAVLLLASAGLLARSFVELMDVDMGFEPDRVVVLPVALDNHEYDSGAKTRAYYRELTERLSAVSGVASVGGVTALPMSPIGPVFDRPIWAEGELPPAGGSRRADVRMATPGYFGTMGMAMRGGRAFDATDTPESPKVVIVSQRLGELIWPGEDPVGRQLVIDYSTAGTYPYEVIGVVSDTRFYGARTAPKPALYLPHAQRSYLIMNIAVRTRDGVATASLVDELRRAVLDVDPMQPAYGVLPLRELVGDSIERDRFAMVLVSAFGAVALALALLGIFGVISYHVSRRTHEVGIRAALGASRNDLVAMVLTSGARLTVAGIGLGLVLAVLGTRALASLLFGVSPLDPWTFAGVTLLPLGGALFACYLPARRAAAVDPVVALRHE